MCIAAIAWNAHPRWKLVVAANRDEFHARPSAPLARWDDGSGTIAGRDLRSGGTWLAVSEVGRLVLVTNFRVPGYPKPDRPSRGGLVTGLLGGASPSSEELAGYNPFNLFHADSEAAGIISNWPGERREALADGVHGLSNGVHDRPWPKTRQMTGALAGWLAADADDFAPLFAALRDEGPAHMPGEDRPEPAYSGVFINDPVYGTRCSTVVAIDRDGAGTITERRFAQDGSDAGESRFPFAWPGDR